MCGNTPDYIGNAIEAIKKIKKQDITEQLSNELYYIMKKLEAIIDARPKPEEDPNDHCECGCY